MRAFLFPGCVLAAGLAVAASAAALASDDRTAPHGWRELFVPSSWSGAWSFRLEYSDPFTGAMVASEEATTSICPADRVGLSLFSSKRGNGCDGRLDDGRRS